MSNLIVSISKYNLTWPLSRLRAINHFYQRAYLIFYDEKIPLFFANIGTMVYATTPEACDTLLSDPRVFYFKCQQSSFEQSPGGNWVDKLICYHNRKLLRFLIRRVQANLIGWFWEAKYKHWSTFPLIILTRNVSWIFRSRALNK